jgi:hypothetical protein
VATHIVPATFSKPRILALGALLVVVGFVVLSCSGITWFVASDVATRRERERIANESKDPGKVANESKDLGKDFKALGKKFGNELLQGWQDAFTGESSFKSPIPLTPDQKAEIDGMRFELLEGKVVKLRLLDSLGDNYRRHSDKEYFSIKYRITNATDNYVFQFSRLLVLHTTPPRFKDEFGNKYMIRYIPRYIEGESKVDNARVDPGQFIVDIMAFELPIPKAQSFTLEVPAHSFGRQGLVQIADCTSHPARLDKS